MKKRFLNPVLGLYIFSAILLQLTPLPGQTALIEVEAAVDKSRITIGDLINYTLTINRDRQLEVHDPGKGTNLGMFEIKEYRITPPREKAGRIIEQFEYTISVYDTGRFVIPPFPVAFTSPGDSAKGYQIITSEPLEIYVESVLNDAEADIIDIRSPRDILADYWRTALLVGGALLLLAAAALGYWYYRKRRAGQPVFRKEVIRPAHEIALEELQKLLNSALLGEGRYKIFYSRLSAILRRYIEERFYINALEETTSELLMSLEEADISSQHISWVREALKQCDLVKFAKYRPQSRENEQAVQWVQKFIEQTRLEFEPVEQLEKVAPGSAGTSLASPDGHP